MQGDFLRLTTDVKRFSDALEKQLCTALHQQNIHLSLNALNLLLVLRREPALSVIELAGKLNISHAAVSKLLKQLRRQQFIEQRTVGTDKRRNEAFLSLRGEQQLAAARQILGQLNSDVRFNNICIEGMELLSEGGCRHVFQQHFCKEDT
ncbi:MarR family winged helix-turn-helix transcriptional regulator [Aliamphritea hakodatensis]|uniref:MarR family winged helix-turn-helix transcriptional regulator n=1 Tax=Aliamphritea hakodatensis TaxID=2895352 RepID=UPI0022FD9A5C|nr:MarR family transcriptional regulator [Aliamphritea hakodatensis]